MPPFYAACDVLVVPSLNSTESFGLVQVEAMLCGTPSIASNLPGVRQPPLMTGMGEVAAIGDSEPWPKPSSASSSTRMIMPAPSHIEDTFSLDRTVAGYEALFGAWSLGNVQTESQAEAREA